MEIGLETILWLHGYINQGDSSHHGAEISGSEQHVEFSYENPDRFIFKPIFFQLCALGMVQINATMDYLKQVELDYRKYNLHGKEVCIPYCYNNHWYMVIINGNK